MPTTKEKPDSEVTKRQKIAPAAVKKFDELLELLDADDHATYLYCFHYVANAAMRPELLKVMMNSLRERAALDIQPA